ncbi:MAG: hypothetical protein WCZ89_08295 [Phycisphaerae bacterium]
MPFSVRPIAVTASIVVFFAIAAIGAYQGHCQFTICKRAFTAVLITYFAASVLVRILNAIVVDAMITRQVNKRINSKQK